jgi:hypothetical protein
MERNIQSHGEHLGQVLLYREDIEHIVGLLKEVSANVELSNREHKFKDVEEWASLKREYFTNMTLAGHNPYVSLDMKENSVWLYIAEDTAQSRGAFEKIGQLLKNRKRPGHWLLYPWMAPIVLNVCCFAFYVGVWHKYWTFACISATLVLGCNGWLWLMWRSRMHRYCVIIPKYRVDAPNFWRRNEDRIIIAIISVAVGSLVTLLIKSLTAKAP